MPGILVYLLFAPRWYGNAAYVRSRFHNLLAASPQPVRGFVLVANAMSDVDFTGAGVLGDLARELGPRGVTLAIARSSRLVHHNLKRSGILEVVGADHLFSSVAEAVEALQSEQSVPSPDTTHGGRT